MKLIVEQRFKVLGKFVVHPDASKNFLEQIILQRCKKNLF